MRSVWSWLNSPIFVWQSLLHVWQTKLQCVLKVWYCFLCFMCCLLTYNSWFRFSPPSWLLFESHCASHCDCLLVVTSYQITVSCRSLLQISLKRSLVFIWCTWPSKTMLTERKMHTPAVCFQSLHILLARVTHEYNQRAALSIDDRL